MSGSDVGLIIVHKAMKIVEKNLVGKIQRGTPTLEFERREEKRTAKGKEKVKMGPPPIKTNQKAIFKRLYKKDSVSEV